MKNMIYTKGFINNSGDIEVPGVFLEEGAEVELKISVARGKFEIALFPSEDKVPFRLWNLGGRDTAYLFHVRRLRRVSA